MSGTDWSKAEVEAIVDDYLSMLASELAGTPYKKAAHRRTLKPLLSERSDQSIEYKHANISAALLDAGFPYINGYKPRSNYQALLGEIALEKLQQSPTLLEIAAADADRPITVPEVEDILSVLTQRPAPQPVQTKATESVPSKGRLTTNYIEREARNRSLGSAGEAFILNYERARLVKAGARHSRPRSSTHPRYAETTKATTFCLSRKMARSVWSKSRQPSTGVRPRSSCLGTK